MTKSLFLISLLSLIFASSANAAYCTTKNWKIASKRGDTVVEVTKKMRSRFNKYKSEFNSIKSSRQPAKVRIERIQKLIGSIEEGKTVYKKLIEHCDLTENKWMVMRDHCFSEKKMSKANSAETKADLYMGLGKSLKQTQKSIKDLSLRVAIHSLKVVDEIGGIDFENCD